MKKTSILTLAVAILISFKASAETQFLPQATENLYTKSSAPNATKCINAGYKHTHTDCNSQTHGQAEKCPYDESYFKTCCPEGYIHQLSECTGNISSTSCHGFYKCDVVSVQERCASEGYTNVSTGPIAITFGDIVEECPYSDDYYKIITSEERCLAEGYSPNPMHGVACTILSCPYNASYGKMDCSAAQTCMDNGYSLGKICNDDQITEICPQNSLYAKCSPIPTVQIEPHIKP